MTDPSDSPRKTAMRMQNGSRITYLSEQPREMEGPSLDDVVKDEARELFRCRTCGLTHPEHPLTPHSEGLGECYMVCPGCGVEGPHTTLRGVSATLRQMDAHCPQCDYTTMLWELDDAHGRLPHCPDCYSPTRVEVLQKVEGVDEDRAHILMQAGYKSIGMLRAATHSDIAMIPGISDKVASYIKSDVGEEGDGSLTAPVDEYAFFDGHEESPRLVVSDATWSFADPSDSDAG